MIPHSPGNEEHRSITREERKDTSTWKQTGTGTLHTNCCFMQNCVPTSTISTRKEKVTQHSVEDTRHFLARTITNLRILVFFKEKIIKHKISERSVYFIIKGKLDTVSGKLPLKYTVSHFYQELPPRFCPHILQPT